MLLVSQSDCSERLVSGSFLMEGDCNSGKGVIRDDFRQFIIVREGTIRKEQTKDDPVEVRSRPKHNSTSARVLISTSEPPLPTHSSLRAPRGAVCHFPRRLFSLRAEGKDWFVESSPDGLGQIVRPGSGQLIGCCMWTAVRTSL
jgi:hypothetical protein